MIARRPRPLRIEIPWKIVAALTAAFLLLSCTAVPPASPGEETPAPATGTFERIRSEGVAVVGFINEPPFSFVSPEGQLTGVQPEIIRAFLATHGVETVDGLLADFAAQIPSLLAGRTDMIGAAMFIRPERCTQIDFGNPDLQVGTAIVVKPGNPLGVHSLTDLAENEDAMVGSITGGQETVLAQVAGIPEERHIRFPDVTAELAAFESDRVNVLIGPSLSFRGIIEANPDMAMEYVALTEQPLDEDGTPAVGYTGVGFRTEDADMRDAYNAFLAEARNSGQLAEIVGQFGLGEEDLAPADLTAAQLCEE